MIFKSLATRVFSHVAINSLYAGIGAGIGAYSTVGSDKLNRNMAIGAIAGLATGHAANFGLTKFRDIGAKALTK